MGCLILQAQPVGEQIVFVALDNFEDPIGRHVSPCYPRNPDRQSWWALRVSSQLRPVIVRRFSVAYGDRTANELVVYEQADGGQEPKLTFISDSIAPANPSASFTASGLSATVMRTMDPSVRPLVIASQSI